ncbi:S8 family serine peptidase [Spongiivirga citrea]|uniref:S8 family serine peptidase n=1 Tax=Spongiivirga citrea TaxID=1481457 RepID=A0A6M0CIF2_9FLAO|nr:S8 family serine peptidase [Spongiivirga citrea]NER17748.1 S8 family serine peptidase [Spongiivirga citrea]
MKPKIALIDGFPRSTYEQVRVHHHPQITYSWDSDFFGVPEFRRHADKMIRVIKSENVNADILVFPFYPKYESNMKNLALLAKNIERAIEHQCSIICICLEVIKGKSLPHALRRVYKKARENGITICISAGNDSPFLNPLIHEKYTIPIVGTTIDGTIPNHLSIKPTTKTLGFSIFGGTAEKPARISCSTATARFSAYLSKKMTENLSYRGGSNFEQILGILEDEIILSPKGLNHIPKEQGFAYG